MKTEEGGCRGLKSKWYAWQNGQTKTQRKSCILNQIEIQHCYMIGVFAFRVLLKRYDLQNFRMQIFTLFTNSPKTKRNLFGLCLKHIAKKKIVLDSIVF